MGPQNLECCIGEGADRAQGVAYNPADEVCCFPNSVPVVYAQTTATDAQGCDGVELCNGEQILPGFACCPGSDIEPEFLYNVASGGRECASRACNGVPLAEGQGCCLDVNGLDAVAQVYQLDEATCCDEELAGIFYQVLHPIPGFACNSPCSFGDCSTCAASLPEGLECCGVRTTAEGFSVETVYDPTVLDCCENSISENSTCEAAPLCDGLQLALGEACCETSTGDVAYLPDSERCCDDGVVAIGESCDVVAEGDCGGEPLSEGLECCGDAELGVAFDAEDDICCDPATAYTAPIGQECDVQVLDCGGLEWPEDRECCGDEETGALYDPDTQQCCDEETVEVRAIDETCDDSPGELCGGMPLTETMLCCGNGTVGTAYSSASQQCCDAATARVAALGSPCDPTDTYSTWYFATPCGDHIYFADYGAGLRRFDPATLTVERFVSGADVRGSVCNGDELIYSDAATGIMRVPLTGGTPTLLTGDGETYAYDLILVDDVLFWNRSAVETDIWRHPIGGTTTTIATAQGGTSRLASDGTYIYFSNTRPGVQPPEIRRVLADGTGGEPTVVMNQLRFPEVPADIIVADGTLYVGMQSSRVLAGPAAGGANYNEVTASAGSPMDLAITDTHIYWRDRTGGSVFRRVRTLDAAPTTVLEFPESGGGGPGDLVIVDGEAFVIDTLTFTAMSAPL